MTHDCRVFGSVSGKVDSPSRGFWKSLKGSGSFCSVLWRREEIVAVALAVFFGALLDDLLDLAGGQRLARGAVMGLDAVKGNRRAKGFRHVGEEAGEKAAVPPFRSVGCLPWSGADRVLLSRRHCPRRENFSSAGRWIFRIDE